MPHSVIVTTKLQHILFLRLVSPIVLTCAVVLGFGLPIYSQDPIIPFEDLLKRPVEIRPELKGVHPRLFFTAQDIPKFRERQEEPAGNCGRKL